jgi:hypothetical protein
MSLDASLRDNLAEARATLAALEPAWINWGKFEAWIAAFRPFVRRNFVDYMADFNEASHKPRWLSLPRTMDRCAEHRADQALHQELETNNGLVQQTKVKLLAFVDGLAQLVPGNAAPDADPQQVFVIHGADRPAY